VLAVIAICPDKPTVTIVQGVSETNGDVLWSQDITANRSPGITAVEGAGFLIEDKSTNKQDLVSAATGRSLVTLGTSTSVYGGQPALELTSAGFTLTLAGLDPVHGSTLWTSSTAVTDTALQGAGLLTAECSGRAYVLSDDSGIFQLTSVGEATGGNAATASEPQLAGADPDVFKCVPGGLLVGSSGVDSSNPIGGEVLFAVG
jgi:hypothetical protein